jgi:dTDP-4-amino-4,6-dideoxygalactose transaminase
VSHCRLAVAPPLPPAVYGRRPVRDLPFPLDRPACVLFARGRHALWHGVRALKLPPGAEVLVPAYHCGCEVEVLLGAGVGCRFYAGTDSLAPDEDELDQLLDERVVGLYLIHTLGFPQDALRWRRWCDANGMLLIEDVAQAWLGTNSGRPLGSFGDLSIFAFYKSFGVPDGAALLLRSEFQPPARRGRLALSTLGKRHAEWLLARSRLLTTLGARLRPEFDLVRQEFDSVSSYATGNPNSLASLTSRFLLPRVADPAAAERRRTNYGRLLTELGDVVAEPFARLPVGASPWAFPILVPDKQELLERLLGQGIRALNFWSVPHSYLPSARFPRASSLRASLVGLPVHQELRESDLARLVAAFRKSHVAFSRATV